MSYRNNLIFSLVLTSVSATTQAADTYEAVIDHLRSKIGYAAAETDFTQTNVDQGWKAVCETNSSTGVNEGARSFVEEVGAGLRLNRVCE